MGAAAANPAADAIASHHFLRVDVCLISRSAASVSFCCVGWSEGVTVRFMHGRRILFVSFA